MSGSVSVSSLQKFMDAQYEARVQEMIASQKADARLERIREAFARADKLRILFVGETIIDEYRYVSKLGMSSKEFVVATVATGEEVFQGGVVAASRHGEWAKAECLSPPAPIRKTRFVDADFNRKLFEVYDQKQIELHPIIRAKFEMELEREIARADVVVVTDFGHGLFGPTPRSVAEKCGAFLAVNAQSNAGNFGFNPITNWKRADFVCIDEPEARLATTMRHELIGDVAEELYANGGIRCDKYLITHGKHGSFFYDMGDVEPTSGISLALASGGIDTIGAGDAVMAVTAPLVAAGLDMESVALVGNVVGALKIGIVGHRRHVGRDEIMAKLEEVLK